MCATFQPSLLVREGFEAESLDELGAFLSGIGDDWESDPRSMSGTFIQVFESCTDAEESDTRSCRTVLNSNH